MCVWVCELAPARFCASLCINDSPNFMVQHGNSVIHFAVCPFVLPMIFSSFVPLKVYVTVTDI